MAVGPLVTVTRDAHEAAERVADVLATAIDSARTIRGVAHVALSGGTTPREAYALLGPRLDGWDDVHVWFADERCVDPDDPEANSRLVRETLASPGATIHRIRDVLAPRLGGHDFALVLTSPLSRARDTALLAGLGDRAEVDDDLLEWDYGEYEGITTPEIRGGRPDWYLWRDGCPGGESPEQVGARCDRVIERIRGVPGDVALFAHGHVLRALGARWVEEPPSFGGRLYLQTGAVCVLGYERDVRVERHWNT